MKGRDMPSKQYLCSVLTTSTLLLTPAYAWGGAWTITQITNNSYDDQGAKVSGNNIVWQARGDIYLFDGFTTKQLTDSGVNAFSDVSGSSVVWSSNWQDIFFYDGTVRQITQNANLNIHPQVSGQNVTWLGEDQGRYGVYFYNGTTTSKLSSSASAGTRPKISGSTVVWPEFDGNDSEIYRFDGHQVTQLTDNDYEDNSPTIDGDRIAWLTNSRTRIAVYDGQTTKEIIPNNRVNALHISGNNVAWDSVDPNGNDEEVYFYDGAEIERLTDNDRRDFVSDVSGSKVTWFQGVGNESDVFVYDGEEVTRLTNNVIPDTWPRVSASNVVWSGSDGHDEEVFLARPVPEPTTITIWLVLGLSFAGIHLRNRISNNQNG